MVNLTDDRAIPEVVFDMVADRKQSAGWVATVEPFADEIVERVFKYRKRIRETDVREIIRRTPSGQTYVRDIYYAGIGGWIVIWNESHARRAGRTSYYAPAFEYFGAWGRWKEPPSFWPEAVAGLEVLADTKYRYSGYSGVGDVIDYLAAWEKDHAIEFFGKMKVTPKKTLAQKCKKDRAFCRFLREHAAEAELYGPQATIAAYKTGETIVEARRRLYDERLARYDFSLDVPAAKGQGIDAQKALAYVSKQKATLHEYNDYIAACVGLGLDLKDTKNAFPHDFARMHDLRVDEEAARKAKERREEAKKLERGFRAAGEKWAATAIHKSGLVVIIPTATRELVNEGERLHHCVGKMGYDKKVADGKSVIAFVRKEEEPETPFVTCEYRLDKRELTQTYGDHDSTPEEYVIAFAKEWAEAVRARQKQERSRA